MAGICYIIGAGEFGTHEIRPSERDFVIAADGGLRHLERIGLPFDLAIGDFDSALRPENGAVITLPAQKDETDLSAAVQQGIQRAYRDFQIYGCLGGRLSHTVANMQLLAQLSQQGLRAQLNGVSTKMTAITNESYHFSAAETGYLSVFACTERCEGVYESGLQYELHDALLYHNTPLGVSNQFIGKESTVSVRSGTLWLLWGEV